MRLPQKTFSLRIAVKVGRLIFVAAMVSLKACKMLIGLFEFGTFYSATDLNNPFQNH